VTGHGDCSNTSWAVLPNTALPTRDRVDGGEAVERRQRQVVARLARDVVDVHREVDGVGDGSVVPDCRVVVQRIVVRRDDDDAVGAGRFGVAGVGDRLPRTRGTHARDDRHVDGVGNRLDDGPTLVAGQQRELAVGSEREDAGRPPVDDEPRVGGGRVVVDTSVRVEGRQGRWNDATEAERVGTPRVRRWHTFGSVGSRQKDADRRGGGGTAAGRSHRLLAPVVDDGWTRLRTLRLGSVPARPRSRTRPDPAVARTPPSR
jgi:hypothetical protein